MPSQLDIEFKKNILQRLGDETHYKMVVFELAERLIQEPKLADLFHNMEVETIYKLQLEFLNLALVDLPSNSVTRSRMVTSTMLHHYRLFELGMCDEHFEIIANNLKESLRTMWADEAVIDDILDLYSNLRSEIFNKTSGRILQAMMGDDHAYEEEEVALPLEEAAVNKDNTTRKKAGRGSRRVTRRNRNSDDSAIDAAGGSSRKGERRLSGESLLSLLRLNDIKRSKKTSKVSQ